MDGNTILPPVEIEAAVYDFLGPDRTINDVERARAALEELYARKGYPTVSAEIPPQRVVGGLVVLRVVERPVGRLRVTGSRYYALGAIRAGAPSLAEGRVPNMDQVKRDIVALNQWPDRTVTPVLRAGRAPDTVDVDLQVQDKLPLHGTLELNNRRSADTTGLRLSGSLSYGNLWQRGDSASVTFQVAPERPSDATVVSGSYLFRIPDSRLSLLASYLHSDSNVSTVGSTNVVGRGTIAGLRLLAPLGVEEGFIHTLSAGFDYKRFTENLTFGGTSSSAPVTYFPFTVGYQADWSGERSQTELTANLVFALRGLGSGEAAFDQKRYNARANFATLRGEASRVQELPYGAQLYGRATGQLANEPLVSSEQFSLGGLDTVRGYLESEALGDYGIAVQAELRSPSVAGRIGHGLDQLRVHLFLDAGTAGIHDPLPEQRRSYTLASAGVGVRVRVFDYLNGSLEDAVALSNGVQTRSGANRVLFRLYGDF